MSSAFADSEFGESVESQLTLGTASLLGIFFGLVMICGIFFGFGYSIGRRSSMSLAANTAAPKATPAPLVATAPSVRLAAPPSAQQLIAQLAPADTPPLLALQSAPAPVALMMPRLTPAKLARIAPAPTAAASATLSTAPAMSGIAHPPVADAKMRIPKPSAFQPLMVAQDIHVPAERIVAGPQFTSQTMPSPYFVWTPPFDVRRKHGSVRAVFNPAAHTALQRAALQHAALTVQIAALSREDDAEVLASALRKGGFAPSIKNGAEDTLYHVQVGPFNREIAFATRQRLIARGYNAILK